MIKNISLIGLCLAVIMLSACSGSSYIQKAKNTASWKQSLKQLESVQRWYVSGKISIRSGESFYTADIFWQQKQHDLKLRLVAPFSQAVTQISGNDNAGYQVLTEQGELMNVDSPESVTENAFGVSLPFSELKSWIKGLPDPHSPVWRASFNDENRLQSFEQGNWQVKILKYKTVGDKVLPSKIFLSRQNDDLSENKADIRLILRRWVL